MSCPYQSIQNLGVRVLKLLLATKREQVLVATGSESREISSLNRYLNWVRDRLNVDAVDVFFVEYVSPDDDMNQVRAILDELHDWKEKELIRYVGVTTHNRPIALAMIESGQPLRGSQKSKVKSQK